MLKGFSHSFHLLLWLLLGVLTASSVQATGWLAASGNHIINPGTTGTSYVVTGLTNGTAYTFAVTASDILAVKGRSGLVLP